MSKLVIYLLVLLNFYCYGERIFELSALNTNKNEVDIRVGEEFVVTVPSNPNYGIEISFVNKDEVSDSLKLIRDAFIPLGNLKYLDTVIVYKYFFFKAVKVTNEAQTLKFANIRRWEKQTNTADYTLKVNVY